MDNKEEAGSPVTVCCSMTNTPIIIDDLLLEILSHLPIKSLFRFKCVSKAWCSLISNYSHQARVLSTLSGLIYETRTFDEDDHLQRVEYKFACLSNEISCATIDIDTVPISLSFLPFYPHFKIVDCCNGLLLCLTGKTKGAIFYVCNPLLKRWIALPNPHTKFKPPDARLVHHPDDSAHFRVLLQSSYSYGYREPAHVAIEVFDSTAGKWEIQDAIFPPLGDHYLSITQSPLLFNEALHYLCYPLRIVRVNVKGGICDAIKLPNRNSQVEGTLLGFEGHLCYLCRHQDYQTGEDKLQVWILEDWDMEEWIKTHEISNKVLVEKILEAGGSPIGNRRSRSEYTLPLAKPLAFGSGLDFALFTDQRKIFSCDLRTVKVEEIFNMGEDDDGTHRRFRFHPALYSPSLNTLEEARHPLQPTK